MEQQLESPRGFCTRPPSCLMLLDDENLDSDQVEKVFNDEARAVQSRLREQLSQLRTELGLFLRLMYKNKNQHRRSLYYQRLSEVRRNLRMLSAAGLDETVECFAKYFSAKRPDGVSSKVVTQSKFKDAIDERKSICTLLSVARLLNQSDGPIMAGSAQLAGLLGQSFFMPFALTMFSCLARFRVLIVQILYEVVTSYNLLSAVWRSSQKSLISSAQRTSGSISFLDRNLPVELECQWDGVKLSMTEKRPPNFPENRGALSDVAAEPSQLWFVDDRTGVKCDLQMQAASAGSSRERLCITSQESLDANKGTLMILTKENTRTVGPSLEDRPGICRPGPSDDVARPSAEKFTTAEEMNDRVEDISATSPGPDLLAKSSMSQSGVTDFSALGASIISRDYIRDSGTNSAKKKSVAYRSISHRISLDSTCTTKNVQNLQLGSKKNGAKAGVDQDVKHALKGPSSHEMPVSGDNANGPLLDNGLIEGKAHSILITTPVSCSSRNMELLESDIVNRDLVEIKLNHEKANASIYTVVSQQSDSGRVVAAAGTSESVIKDVVTDARKASGGGVAAIADTGTFLMANSELRTALEHKTEISPECTEEPNKAVMSTSPNHDTVQDKPVDSSGLNVNHISRKVVEGGAVDQSGSSDFGEDRSLFPDSISSVTSFEDTDSHGLQEKIDIRTQPNNFDVDAVMGTCVNETGRQNAGPDGPIAQSSLSETDLEFHMAGPDPSELMNVSDSRRSYGNDVALKGSQTCISANSGLTKHSNGKEDRTRAVAGDTVGDCLTRLTKKADMEQVSEESLGKTARASISDKLQNANGGERVPVAHVSIRSGLKASQNKRENDSKLRAQPTEIASSEVRQKLKTGSKPQKSGLKRGNVDSKDRPSESEPKRKKADDIFVMLLGGSN